MERFSIETLLDTVVMEAADKAVEFLLQLLKEMNEKAFYQLAWVAKNKPALLKSTLVSLNFVVELIAGVVLSIFPFLKVFEVRFHDKVVDAVAKVPTAVEKHFMKNEVVFPPGFQAPDDEEIQGFLKKKWEEFVVQCKKRVKEIEARFRLHWDVPGSERLQIKLESLRASLKDQVASQRQTLAAGNASQRAALSASLAALRTRSCS